MWVWNRTLVEDQLRVRFAQATIFMLLCPDFNSNASAVLHSRPWMRVAPLACCAHLVSRIILPLWPFCHPASLPLCLYEVLSSTCVFSGEGGDGGEAAIGRAATDGVAEGGA